MTKILAGLLFSLFISGKTTINDSIAPKKRQTVRITFTNKTKRLVSLAVHLMPYNTSTGQDEDWTSMGWYNLEAGQTVTFETWNYTFYYYAEMPPDFFGNKRVWSGDYNFEVRGEVYSFKKVDLSGKNLSYNQNYEAYEYNLNLVKY